MPQRRELKRAFRTWPARRLPLSTGRLESLRSLGLQVLVHERLLDHWLCHSYAPDGRCISLLKILLDNFCT